MVTKFDIGYSLGLMLAFCLLTLGSAQAEQNDQTPFEWGNGRVTETVKGY